MPQILLVPFFSGHGVCVVLTGTATFLVSKYIFSDVGFIVCFLL